MRQYLLVILCTFVVMMCGACQTKEDSSIRDLQESICRLSSVANKIDHDIESMWAYRMADSIAGSMELKDESIWRDLSRAYSALSYIGYGMSYVRTVRHGDLDLLRKLTEVVVNCNPDTVMPNRSLHLMELKSDQSFINFYGVSNMEATESMMEQYENYSNMLDFIYSTDESASPRNLSENFMQFQRENKCFFFIYASMLFDLISINSATEEEHQRKCDVVMELANEMDSLPSEWEARLSKQIEVRARLISMLSDEIEALE